MSTLSQGKIAEVIYENALETLEDQDTMLDLVSFIKPDAADMQNSGNVLWRQIQQQAPIIEGFDLSTQEQEIIQETYPAVLGLPQNDFVQQRADDIRDMQFWKERGQVSARRQASNLNQQITQAMVDQGSLFYRSAATSGFDFISEGQALMNERQGAMNERCFLLNDRDTQKYAQDLAGRETIKGRPADTWSSGQIGSNVAQFNIFNGSFLPTH